MNSVRDFHVIVMTAISRESEQKHETITSSNTKSSNRIIHNKIITWMRCSCAVFTVCLTSNWFQCNSGEKKERNKEPKMTHLLQHLLYTNSTESRLLMKTANGSIHSVCHFCNRVLSSADSVPLYHCNLFIILVSLLNNDCSELAR